MDIYMNIIDHNIIGQSEIIQYMRHSIKKMAQYHATVLVTGETGTGKELVARGLHYGGELASKPFIAINCSTFSDELFASELFGYTKGAFTDAKTDKDGLLTSVNGGTIFLDEIDSLSLKSQAALLRVLQESEFRPIGSNEVQKTNVRFIAAANCNLQNKISQNEFRQDLYFRLFILSVKVPSLRERKEDIPLLVEHFIQKLNSQYGLDKKGLSNNLLNRFQHHDWPGNIRELENSIHRHYLLSKNDLLDDDAEMLSGSADSADDNRTSSLSKNHMSDHLRDTLNQMSIADDLMTEEMDLACLSFAEAKRQAIEVFEAKFVSHLLHFTKGNVTKAATLCGKERRAFGKLVKKYDIKSNEIHLY